VTASISRQVLLLTDRAPFESSWRALLEPSELPTRVARPEAVASALDGNGWVVVDAACEFFDEDELLATVGFLRALRVGCAVALPAADFMVDIQDLLEDLCPGAVCRGQQHFPRLASAIARRVDRGRAQRFEYLTVSPRPGELLAILADGTAALLSRPVTGEDDGSDVTSIALAAGAATATLSLESGREIAVSAAALAVNGAGKAAAARGGENGIDGVRLGARLRELRMAAGLTQAELARRTGIHRPNIARVEAGRHTPSLETLARLASAIGVTTTHVLAEE